jgi:hypothetical protein
MYEVYDFKHAAAILSTEFPEEFNDIIEALRIFRIDIEHITIKGGRESQIPKTISSLLRPDKDNPRWKEGKLNAKLLVDDTVVSIDTHKIDYLKGRVAFDLEWNSKDQTYDRDLYAFRAFFDYDKISVGILLTRSVKLNPLFKVLDVMKKYGSSTTQMNKLLPRLKAGRNGGCPVLVFGITPSIVTGNIPDLTGVSDDFEEDENTEESTDDLSLKSEEVIKREIIKENPPSDKNGKVKKQYLHQIKKKPETKTHKRNK